MNHVYIISDFRSKKHKLFWSTDEIDYSGIPFMILSQKVLDCSHGADRKIVVKEKKALEKNQQKVRLICLYL